MPTFASAGLAQAAPVDVAGPHRQKPKGRGQRQPSGNILPQPLLCAADRGNTRVKKTSAVCSGGITRLQSVTGRQKQPI